MSKKNYSIFICCDKEFEHKEMLKHLENVHLVNIREPMKQEMIAHMDGRDWFSTTYKYTTKEGIEFTNSVRCTRNGLAHLPQERILK